MFPPYLLKTLLHIGYQPPSSQLSLREQGLLAGSIGHPLSQHCWPKSTSYIFLTLLFLSPALGLRKRLLAPQHVSCRTLFAVRVPSVFFQPILSDDVVAALLDVTLGAPVNDIIDLAGPERFRFDEIIGQFLSATQETRQVVTDMHARYFGAKLDEQSLVPRGNSQIGATRFEDWLSLSTVKN